MAPTAPNLMTPADHDADSGARPGSSIDPHVIGAALRRLGKTPADASDPRTACPAPDHYLVVDADGRLRACEHGLQPVGDASGGCGEWRDGNGFARLREDLAAFRLPPHCATCSQWLRDDLFSTAPPIALHAELGADAPAGFPTRVVLRMPADAGAPAAPGGQLTSLLANARSLVVEASAASPALAELVQSARLVRPDLSVRLQVRDAGGLESLAETLRAAGAAVSLELTVQTNDVAAAAAAAALFASTGAAARLRFVLTPADWFDLERIHDVAAAHGLPSDLHVLDRYGAVPLATAGPDALQLVQEALIACWERARSRSATQPALLRSLEVVIQEVRALLGRAIGGDRRGDGASLGLPPLDHPWFDPDGGGDWWLAFLFGRTDRAPVSRWLSAFGSDLPWAAGVLRANVGARALVHDAAANRRDHRLLEVLRETYAPPSCQRLHAEDDAFATRFDLARFGGPWTGALGLRTGDRQPPFVIGDARTPDGGPPDITVLVPSFRHETYIEATLRSVLAQSYTRFRVLVVDDGSPDATVERARAIADPRIEVRTNARNLGLGTSILNALADVSTPYVAVLNSDDLLHPDHLATCLSVLAAEPSTQLVACDLFLIDRFGGEITPGDVSLVFDGPQITDWVHWHAASAPSPAEQDDLFGSLLQRNYLITSSNIVARADWLRDQAATLARLKYCLDWQLFLEAARQRALHHLRARLVAYRLHPTNTVWFDDRRRFLYHFEVNRVAAQALKRVANEGAEGDTTGSVVALVADHVTRNSEIDGVAMFLNTVVDPARLDELAVAPGPMQTRLERLTRLAEAPPAIDGDVARRTSLAGEVWADHAAVERAGRRWLEGRVDEVQRELAATRDRLQHELAAAAAHCRSLEATVGQLRGERDATAAALGAREQEVRQLGEQVEAQRRAVEELTSTTTALRQQLEATLQQLRRTTEELAAERASVHGLQRAVDGVTLDLLASRERGDRLARDLEDSARASAALHAERERLLASREFRTGDLVWNRMRLAEASRRLKKWYRRLCDLGSRLALRGAGLFGRKPTIVVASTREWPLYYHTFVYQEMLGFRDRGWRVRLFHWDRTARWQSHAAFASLRSGSVRLQPIEDVHRRDLRHFDRTRPGRLDAFLQQVSRHTGRAVAELREDPLVLRACTFARLAELARPRYLHSYFFYDQAFMAMQAAWLLGLPRGVTCYADHMLADHPLKLVSLHLELADVLVASTARVAEELRGLCGPEHHAKIVVKHNGVDGARIPRVSRRGGSNDSRLVVLSVSRIEPKKGLLHLVEAVLVARTRGVDVTVHLVGAHDPQDRDAVAYHRELVDRIARAGLTDRFVLHGALPQESLPPLREQCDAFVAPYVELPSGDKDGIPTSLLEAMAAGMPVIASDASSIPEAIQHDQDGLLVPQGHPEALAQAFERLAADPSLRTRLADGAHERFRAQFDVRVTEAPLHARVAQVLAQRR